MIESECCKTPQRTDSLIYRLIWSAKAARHVRKTKSIQASLPGDHRAMEPPDPIPNSEVKRCIADGSVGFPHVRVGHCQAPKKENPHRDAVGVLFFKDARNLCPVLPRRSRHVT